MSDLLTMPVPPMVWPLVFLLVVLVGAHTARETLTPIIENMTKALAIQAQNNAVAVMMAILFGLSASLSAFYDLFSQLTKTDLNLMSWHQYAALWTKILNPFVVAVLAYATQNKFKTVGTSTGNTTPPI